MEHCLFTQRRGSAGIHSPTWSHDPSHLGLLRCWLWLHQKRQGSGQELEREPGTSEASHPRFGLICCGKPNQKLVFADVLNALLLRFEQMFSGLTISMILASLLSPT